MKRFLILALCAGATACGGNKNGYDASGTFEATEVIVSSEANGRITSFGVEEGRRLAAGQTVGTVDSVQLYLKKLQLQKQLGATRSRTSDIGKQIAATQQQIATQQREKRRVENLLKADAANTKQLDDIDAQIAVLENSSQRSSRRSKTATAASTKRARPSKFRWPRSKTSSPNAAS